MVHSYEREFCEVLYRQKSKANISRKQEQYEQWIKDYTPFLMEAYNLTISSVKGVNPSYDDFCRFFYKSQLNGFDPKCVKARLG